jgi:hypothetical protein
MENLNVNKCPGIVTHACNPSYMGVDHQEDGGYRPAWAKS